MKRDFTGRSGRLSLLACAAALLLAGCSKDRGGDQGPVRQPIRLGSSVAATKAAVLSGDTFTASVAGWESTSGADYTLPAAWTSTAVVTASASAAPLALTPEQYYFTDITVTTHMRGWFPCGELSGGIVDLRGDGFYASDGSMDLLLSDPVSGSATDREDKTLLFRHPLVQLRLRIVADPTFDPGITLASLTLKDALIPTGIDLTAGTPLYAPAADVPVRGSVAGVPITAAEVPVGEAMMVGPYAGRSLRMDIETSQRRYENVEISVDDERFTPGRAYTLTLTFTGYEVKVGSSVDEWSDGEGGGTVIE